MNKEEIIFRIKRNKLSKREAIILLSDFLGIKKADATKIYEEEVVNFEF